MNDFEKVFKLRIRFDSLRNKRKIIRMEIIPSLRHAEFFEDLLNFLLS
jgi:hypothetical protein